tara:strand:- start:331 stop:495 length:165 start_codon:yes stop_codon:yes gene_type:complete
MTMKRCHCPTCENPSHDALIEEANEIDNAVDMMVRAGLTEEQGRAIIYAITGGF